MSKVPKRGQDSTYDYLWQQAFFEKSIRPILGENAVDQELVAVPEPALIGQLNDILESINQTRKLKFRGSFVGQSSWGLLVDDMRPRGKEEPCPPILGVAADPVADPSLYTLVEFKPKWLSQSPNAPADAIRCRQCALELRYFITNPNSDRPLPSQKPCPLAVCEDDPPPEVASPLRMAPKLVKIAQPARDQIAAQLRGITGLPALKELRRQQDIHDPAGPLHADPADPDFALAMTIRDCTCFVQVALSPLGTDPARPRRLHFGDLDWKDPKRKFEHWRGTEEALVDGGFYTADRIRCDAKLYQAPTKCLLEWTSAAKHIGNPRVLEVIQLGDTPDRASASVHVLAGEDVVGLQRQLVPYGVEALPSPTELYKRKIRNLPA